MKVIRSDWLPETTIKVEENNSFYYLKWDILFLITSKKETLLLNQYFHSGSKMW